MQQVEKLSIALLADNPTPYFTGYVLWMGGVSVPNSVMNAHLSSSRFVFPYQLITILPSPSMGKSALGVVDWLRVVPVNLLNYCSGVSSSFRLLSSLS